MTTRRFTGLRGAGLLVVLGLVVILSLGNSGWAQVAGAQTVPTLTYTPGANPTSVPPAASTPTGLPPGATEPATPTPAEATNAPTEAATPTATAAVPADLAACGAGPYGLSAAGDRLLNALLVSSGGVTVLGVEARVEPDSGPAKLAGLRVETIPLSQLPAAPPGARLLACGLRATATDVAGRMVSLLTRGLVVCLPAPTDGVPARLAYFDARAGIKRWVFLPTRHSVGPLCAARFHGLGLFALLALAP